MSTLLRDITVWLEMSFGGGGEAQILPSAMAAFNLRLMSSPLYVATRSPVASSSRITPVYNCRDMRWLGWVLLLLLAGGYPPASAWAPAGELGLILEGFNQLRRQTDFTGRGRLVQVDDAGTQTSFDLRVKSKSFGETFLLYWEITGPDGGLWRLLAEAVPGKAPVVRLASPGSAAPELLTSARQQEDLVGTNLSVEDLLNQHLFWKSSSLLGREKVGARECFQVQSQPEDGLLTSYSSVTTWLDTQSYFPVKIEKQLPDGRLKTMTSRGIRRRQGTWGASRLVVTVSWNASRTLLTLTGGSAKADLQIEEFSISRLFPGSK